MTSHEYIILDYGAVPNVVPAPQDAAVAHLGKRLERVVLKHEGVSSDFYITRDSRTGMDKAHEFIPESFDAFAQLLTGVIEVACAHSNEGAVRFGWELFLCRVECDNRKTN